MSQNKKYLFSIIQKYLIVLGMFFIFYSYPIFSQILINRDSSYQNYKNETDYWNEKGQEYFEQDEDWRKALRAHEQAYKIASIIDYTQGKANALRNQGILEARFDNRQRAEKYFLEELKLRKQLQNVTEISISNQHIGLFYADIQADYELAIGYLLQTFYINQKMFDDEPEKMRKDYENIIKVGLHLENVSRIKKFQEKYLNLYFIPQQDFFEAAKLCVDWSNRYMQYKDYENAFYFIKKAEFFANKLPTSHQYKEYFEEHKQSVSQKYTQEQNTIYRTKLLSYGLVVVVVGIGLVSFYFSWRVILLRSKK